MYIYIYMCVCKCLYVYVYIYICVCMCVWFIIRQINTDSLLSSASPMFAMQFFVSRTSSIWPHGTPIGQRTQRIRCILLISKLGSLHHPYHQNGKRSHPHTNLSHLKSKREKVRRRRGGEKKNRVLMYPHCIK